MARPGLPFPLPLVCVSPVSVVTQNGLRASCLRHNHLDLALGDELYAPSVRWQVPSCAMEKGKGSSPIWNEKPHRVEVKVGACHLKELPC